MVDIKDDVLGGGKVDVVHVPEAFEQSLPNVTKARVALMGGSFNPPHMGHLMLAQTLLSLSLVDEIWITPVADHPLGKKNIPFKERQKMCQLSFKYISDKCHILDSECYIPKPSYTLQTLKMIKEVRPNIDIVLALGSDILYELDRWHAPEELKNYSQIVIFPRHGYPTDQVPEYLGAKVITHFVLPEISSTDLRHEFNKLSELDGRIDVEVLRFARENQLY